jgi:hypothetical protein
MSAMDHKFIYSIIIVNLIKLNNLLNFKILNLNLNVFVTRFMKIILMIM